MSLPTVGLYSGLYGAYYIYLSMQVVEQRRKLGVSLGDGTFSILVEKLQVAADDAKGINIFKDGEPTDMTTSKYWELTKAVRAQGNFSEHVPWLLIFAAIAEINGLLPEVLHGILSVFFFARLMFNHFGIHGAANAIGNWRRWGSIITFVSIVGLGVYNSVHYFL
ncbi:hypothetical protein HK098_006688 [Nowakowskiella sp. JEL0407]|nr:hypothetical protein HK098_006688 [Nowakowskiella sp. JEL0407]